MNKEESLRETAKMWRWLEQNPDKEKYEYVKDKPMVVNGCYLCQLVFDATGEITTDACESSPCPLLDFWNLTTSSRDPDNVPCERVGTPYWHWKNSPPLHYKSYYAKQIADAAEAELLKLTPYHPEPKFKVGDRVIMPTGNFMGGRTGEEFIIAHIEKEWGHSHYHYYSDEKDFIPADEDWLELAPPEEK